MKKTKCDISGDEVKLDITATLKTAKIAVGLVLEKINGYLAKYGNDYRADKTSSMVLDAHWLYDSAGDLVVTTEVLATLMCSSSRETLTILQETSLELRVKSMVVPLLNGLETEVINLSQHMKNGGSLREMVIAHIITKLNVSRIAAVDAITNWVQDEQ